MAQLVNQFGQVFSRVSAYPQEQWHHRHRVNSQSGQLGRRRGQVWLGQFQEGTTNLDIGCQLTHARRHGFHRLTPQRVT